MSAAAILALSALAPAALAAALWAIRRPSVRERTGMLLASAWLLATIPPLNQLAEARGWWRFTPASDAWPHLPGALLVGWMAVWTLVPMLAMTRVPVAMVAIGALWLDLLLMPRLEPVLVLGRGWLWGEAALVAFALVPARLLAAWTAEDRRLYGRAALQAACFALLLMVALPGAIDAGLRIAWPSGVLHLPPLVSVFNALQLLIPPALLGLAAVREFAVRGGGTPVPFDPPRRLVTSGPYAFVANPMQVAAAAIPVLWGMLRGEPWMAAAGVVSIVYSAGVAAGDEGDDLAGRFGGAWRAYRRHVREWRPRWRPWHPSLDGGAEPARLYVARGCDICSDLGAAVELWNPVGLVIVPAEEHPSRQLTRITYDPRDGGAEEEGVAAYARSLEHVNFALAMLGMAMRLPIVRYVLQLIADSSGAGPRAVAWRGLPADVAACERCVAAPRTEHHPSGWRPARSQFRYVAIGG